VTPASTKTSTTPSTMFERIVRSGGVALAGDESLHRQIGAQKPEPK
jgi:hypothetical protein